MFSSLNSAKDDDYSEIQALRKRKNSNATQHENAALMVTSSSTEVSPTSSATSSPALSTRPPKHRRTASNSLVENFSPNPSKKHGKKGKEVQGLLDADEEKAIHVVSVDIKEAKNLPKGSRDYMFFYVISFDGEEVKSEPVQPVDRICKWQKRTAVQVFPRNEHNAISIRLQRYKSSEAYSSSTPSAQKMENLGEVSCDVDSLVENDMNSWVTLNGIYNIELHLLLRIEQNHSGK